MPAACRCCTTATRASSCSGSRWCTPQGEIWNGLRALKKDNTGYDLRDLYLGAEGTLGIITKAMLKLWPKPKDVATSWIAVPSPEAAVALLSGALCRERGQRHLLRADGPPGHRPGAEAHPRRRRSAGRRARLVRAAGMVVDPAAPRRRQRDRACGEDGSLSRRGDGTGPGARCRARPERGAGARLLGACARTIPSPRSAKARRSSTTSRCR